MSSDADIATRLRRAADSLPVTLPASDRAIHNGRARWLFRLASVGAAAVVAIGGLTWAVVALGPLGGDGRSGATSPATAPGVDRSTFRIVQVPYSDEGIPVPENWKIENESSRGFSAFAATSDEQPLRFRPCDGPEPECTDDWLLPATLDGRDAYVSVTAFACCPKGVVAPLPSTLGPAEFIEAGKHLGGTEYIIFGLGSDGGWYRATYWIGPDATDSTRDATLFVVEHLGFPTGTSAPVTFTNDELSFSVTFPEDWTRSTVPPDPEVLDPVELTTLATFDPAIGYPGCEAFPAEVGDDAAYVQVLERNPSYRRETFPPRPREFGPESAEQFSGWKDCHEFSPNYDAYWIPFTDAGRNFYAFVAIGPEASEQRMADTWAILNSLQFEPRESSAATVHEDPDGFTVTVPDGWEVADESLTPELVDPREILSMGTFSMAPGEAGCDFYLPSAGAQLGPMDGFITMQEAQPAYAGMTREEMQSFFAPRPESFEKAAHRIPCLHAEGSAQEWRIDFRDQGRYFYVYVAIGGEATPEREAEVWAILDSLEFDPA